MIHLQKGKTLLVVAVAAFPAVVLPSADAQPGTPGSVQVKASRVVDYANSSPGCHMEVMAFEVDAFPDSLDYAMMFYGAGSVTSNPGYPGVLSPHSGVNFYFLNLNTTPWMWGGPVPWVGSGDRKAGYDTYFPSRYTSYIEMGPGPIPILGIFVGPDTPTGGPACMYAQVVVSNGSTYGCEGSAPILCSPPMVRGQTRPEYRPRNPRDP